MESTQLLTRWHLLPIVDVLNNVSQHGQQYDVRNEKCFCKGCGEMTIVIDNSHSLELYIKCLHFAHYEELTMQGLNHTL
jgi:hypothetical protein